MAELVIKLPDIGEGITEAEISEWEVEVGDWINEDDIIGSVLTDKAAVEIPSSASGKVLWRSGEPGDKIAIGAPLVKIDADGRPSSVPPAPGEPDRAEVQEAEPVAGLGVTLGISEDSRAGDSGPGVLASEPPEPTHQKTAPGKALAAPAVRRRAADLGLDLARVDGTGPGGRVLHADLDRSIVMHGPESGGAPVASEGSVRETKVIGLRRKIAEQMSRANARIPQITIVEEVDVTELERLRAAMNAKREEEQPKLTLLPFLMRGVIEGRKAAPQVNARYDDEAAILSEHDAVHFGIATQTPQGLMVPVLRHAETLSVWQTASEISRLAEAARAGSLSREDLSGSTITITSLGPLGAIATTPIVNYPEVAIVGVNRKQVRPQWDGQAFVPREMMNISASFDHRIVDGWDAAQFIARIKVLLETPALLFV